MTRYRYFDRDISWLSFNYRVLLEATNEFVPIYERIKFLSIHASNLEEFFKVRVAQGISNIVKEIELGNDVQEAEANLAKIRVEVDRQQHEFSEIFRLHIIPSLYKNNIILYHNQEVESFHIAFAAHFFREEVFPYLQPVMLLRNDVQVFIRDSRLYLVVRLIKKVKDETFLNSEGYYYALIKIPYSKSSRFVALPCERGFYYYMFLEDLIKSNLSSIFPGFIVESAYSIKTSRDAAILIEDDKTGGEDLAQRISKNIKRRNLGEMTRFVYDRNMPQDFRDYLCETFGIFPDDMSPDNPHLSMEYLQKLPNPIGYNLEQEVMVPIRIAHIDKSLRIFTQIKKRDLFLYYPYHSFEYFLRFLRESAADPRVEEIKITQYRVAQESAVIEALIAASGQGKKITVFVEIKARFDEANNIKEAKKMKDAGIDIIYSLSGLKVHAKIALVVLRASKNGGCRQSFAYFSTGNFNEKTAKLYADMAVLTAKKKICTEVCKIFELLEGNDKDINFETALVSQFNMVSEIKRMISREIAHVKQGFEGRIILKMNGLQAQYLIDDLYEASLCGVQIDLIVRGICCIVPKQAYSKNIRITRIVDAYLEHARIWYFYNKGIESVFLASADWMERNLFRRIEAAFPILDLQIKSNIISILNIQLQETVKACFIDEQLQNVFKHKERKNSPSGQQEIYQKIKTWIQ